LEDTYLKDFTKDWELLESKGNLELYSYFDKLYWDTRYAIRRDSTIVYTFEENIHGNKYDFFNAVSIVVAV
jgi:hypothetical protein